MILLSFSIFFYNVLRFGALFMGEVDGPNPAHVEHQWKEFWA